MDKPKVTMMRRSELEERWNSASDEDTGCIALCDFQALSGRGLDVPVVESLDAEILKAIDRGGKLDMGDWHDFQDVHGGDNEGRRRAVCGTTHCRAGWAIHLAGEAGFQLEMATDPETAGALIYFASTGTVPDFFADNEEAMEDMRRCAGVKSE